MALRPNIDTALTIALLPLLAVQLVWVKLRALHLPEPAGPRSGVIGTGPKLRLLVVGDSSAAGVGVDTQQEALTQQLAQLLGWQHTVHWHLCAKNGATTADVPDLLAPVAGQKFDLALAIFGVNDAKNLRPESSWRRDLNSLITRLQQDNGVEMITFSGLPRVQDFPLIPNPLRAILAMRVTRFDAALQQIAIQHGCHHFDIDIPLSKSGMARDGFHPGAPIYRHWAQVMAARFMSTFPLR